MKRTNKLHGFSLIEIVIVIAILAVLMAILVPALIHYTEDSRAQKDVTTMDEVVNAVQLALADQDCFDEMELYSFENNFITYTDSSGKYGQQIVDAEYWAPDGYGKATTITFNPEKDSSGNTIYRLDKALINDMTFGNGSVAAERVMEGVKVDDNQCYLSEAKLSPSQESGYLYNHIRQTIGNDVITTSATYANSSFTIFIRFSQKDGVTVADVNGSFNGTNLHNAANASLGSGTNSEIVNPETGDKEQGPATTPSGGTTSANFHSSALSGGGNSVPSYANNSTIQHGQKIPKGGVYLQNVEYYYDDEDTHDWVYDAETTLTEGDQFPDPQPGDFYRYGNYEYCYGYQYCDCICWSQWCGCFDIIEGWSARCVNDVARPGPLLSSINNKPLLSLSSCFYEMYNLSEAPLIPATVESLYCTFNGCSSLKTPPIIPRSVQNMYGTFAYSDLSKAPIIPDTVKNLFCTFSCCYSLTTAPIIPENVEDLGFTFEQCLTLEGTVTINAKNLINYNGCFSDTLKKITLIGESPDLEGLAETDTKENVFIYCEEDTVPMGVTYVSASGETYNAGDKWPELTPGDIYRYKNYEYCYGYEYCDCICWSTECGCFMEIDGWAVICTNNIAEPGVVLNEIRNRPVTHMDYTFLRNDKVQYIYSIPDSIISMEHTFDQCTSLRYVENLPANIKKLDGTFIRSSIPESPKIPESVTMLTATFRDCKSLKKAPAIPNSVINMDSAFAGCNKLTSFKTLPSQVQSLNYTFQDCSLLREGPSVIPQSVTSMNYTFDGCITLKQGPDIPDTVTSQIGVFSGCRTFTKAPKLSSKATNWSHVFDTCDSLLEPPEIPQGVTNLSYAFFFCKKLQYAPVIPDSVTDMSFAFNFCESLKTAPTIPQNVTNLYNAFRACTSLEGTVIINASNLTKYAGCFSLTTNQIELTGDCPKLAALANTAENKNVKVKN